MNAKLKLIAFVVGTSFLGACSATKQDNLTQTAEIPSAQINTTKAAKPVDEKYIWDLTDLYPSTADWQKSYKNIKQQVAQLSALQGSLGFSPLSLLSASEQISSVRKEVARLYVYASLKADENLKIAQNEERRQLAKVLYSDFTTAVSWYNPEVLSLDEDKIRQFLAQEPKLAEYKHSLENILRNKPHTLEPKVEEVLAKSSKITGAANSIYSVFTNADMSWPEITLSNGETHTLNKAGYGKLRQISSRSDRKQVFDDFWGSWKAYEATLGNVLNSHVQGLALNTQVRNYDSSLGRALFEDNMPESVYRTLVAEVNRSLPTLHRYFKLRKRMLNIKDEMRYYDIYPPMVELDKTFSIEDSIAMTRRAILPLGEEYLAAYDKGVNARWMHVYPQSGKRSGAYMSGWAYDVHPYVLLNHNDDYNSASTFAHEFGHAVHSILSNKYQTWQTAAYSTFVAETAAIMNEMLLEDMVIREAKSDQEKLYYLGLGLEGLRGTFFRQTMFAEFELKMNEAVEAGEILTGSKLSAMYLDLLKRYHGHDQGVMKIDDAYAIEWAFIPHFYYDFYVFQYSTSITAAVDFAEKVANGDTQTRDAFIEMLKAGGSDHPYDLMKKAGVDMAKPEPYQALVKRMNKIMDEMEAILEKQ